MDAIALRRIVTLGAMTGMRGMAGAATLALEQGGLLRRVPIAIAGAEMVVDKVAGIGDRIDPIPLAGRAVMGALVGGAAARSVRSSIALGCLLGSAAAILTTYAAYHVRARLPLPNALAGALEDSVVIGLATRYGRGDSAAKRKGSSWKRLTTAAR